jgi:hypothetical protein
LAARLKRLRKSSFAGEIFDLSVEAAVDIIGFLWRDWKSRLSKPSRIEFFRNL